MVRKEDPELLTGEGRFIDDLVIPGARWLGMVRSPFAHARITGIDVSEALTLPGVTAVLTGADLRDAWVAPDALRLAGHRGHEEPRALPRGHRQGVLRGRHRRGGRGRLAVRGRRRRRRRRRRATSPSRRWSTSTTRCRDRVVIHDALGTNKSYTWELIPDPAAVDAAFAGAAHVVKERYIQQRLIPPAMEPRGVAVVPQPHGGEVTVWSATQIPHILKIMLTATTGMPEHKLRVIAPAVGGGFGSKLDVYAEELIALAVARQLRCRCGGRRAAARTPTPPSRAAGRSRTSSWPPTPTARSPRCACTCSPTWARTSSWSRPASRCSARSCTTASTTSPRYSFTCTSVFTNKTPTDAYRGAGRPEATYAIERAMDALARQVGVGPDEIRRRNFIPAESFPYSSAAGLVFDSGDYAPNLAEALELVRWDDRKADQAKRRASGDPVELGLGISTYVEMCGLAPSRVLASLSYGAGGWEAATVRMLPPAPCRWSPAPPRTGRATRRRGRCSSPTSSA